MSNVSSAVLSRLEGGGAAAEMGGRITRVPQADTYPTSISGLLCRSTICEAKFSMQSAASRVALMQSRYGLSA